MQFLTHGEDSFERAFERVVRDRRESDADVARDVARILSEVRERGDDALGLGLGEHADAAQHGGVGDGAHEVMPPQPAVERDRLGELGHVLPWPTAEPAAPRQWR